MSLKCLRCKYYDIYITDLPCVYCKEMFSKYIKSHYKFSLKTYLKQLKEYIRVKINWTK